MPCNVDDASVAAVHEHQQRTRRIARIRLDEVGRHRGVLVGNPEVFDRIPEQLEALVGGSAALAKELRHLLRRAHAIAELQPDAEIIRGLQVEVAR